jgi:hypothetical protein
MDQLAPGTYSARATSWAWDASREGTPCLAVRFALEGSDVALDGRLFFDSDRPDKAGKTPLDRSLVALRAMGLEGPLAETMTGLDRGTVELVTDINDRGYPRIKWINPPSRSGDGPVRVFAAPPAPTLRAFLARVNAAAPAPRKADVPF